MKRIVILGNSAAASAAIAKIREIDPESSIQMFSFENELPYDPGLFADYVARKIEAEQLFCRPADFYNESSVELVLDAKISRVNLKRKKIFFEDKEEEPAPFDIILITDVKDKKFPKIKGANKEGVLDNSKLSDVKKIAEKFSLWDTIIIRPQGLAGLKMAFVLSKAGKEVVVVSSEERLGAPVLKKTQAEPLKKHLEDSGVTVYLKTDIQEILGDQDVKAIKMGSGKVIACQLILFAKTELDFRMFGENSMETEEKIKVDVQMKTSMDDVLAAGSVCQVQDDSIGDGGLRTIDDLFSQGKIAGMTITGQEAVYASVEDILTERTRRVQEFLEGLGVVCSEPSEDPVQEEAMPASEPVTQETSGEQTESHPESMPEESPVEPQQTEEARAAEPLMLEEALAEPEPSEEVVQSDPQIQEEALIEPAASEQTVNSEPQMPEEAPWESQNEDNIQIRTSE